MTIQLIEVVKGLTEKKLTFDIKQTLQVLRQNLTIYWSWGVSDLLNINDKGLLFRVRGHHHKGYVFITLDYTDTYDVYLISTHGNIVKKFDMVYFDNLVEIIDDNVERIKEYSH